MEDKVIHYLIKTATLACGTKRYAGVKGSRITALITCETCKKIALEELEKIRATQIIRHLDMSKPIIKDEKGMYKNA